MENSLTEDFKKDKFVVIRKLISEDTLDLLTKYIEVQKDHRYFEKTFFSTHNTKYGDVVMESLMLSVKPKLEEIVQCELIPTFAHMRIYTRGRDLKVHRDRPSCEYTTSLTIEYDSDYIWPIFVLKGGERTDFHLDRGDLLLFKGCELPHGRDPFKGKVWIQVFLNYVGKHGPFEEWKMTKEKNLVPLVWLSKYQRSIGN